MFAYSKLPCFVIKYNTISLVFSHHLTNSCPYTTCRSPFCSLCRTMVYTEFKLFVGGLSWETTAETLKVKLLPRKLHSFFHLAVFGFFLFFYFSYLDVICTMAVNSTLPVHPNAKNYVFSIGSLSRFNFLSYSFTFSSSLSPSPHPPPSPPFHIYTSTHTHHTRLPFKTMVRYHSIEFAVIRTLGIAVGLGLFRS